MRLWPSALAGLLATVATLLAPTALLAAPSSPYTYVHDDAGRLIAAVDPDDETARYHYDAAGNLVSIDRVSSATTRVAPFGNRGPGRFHWPHYHRAGRDAHGNVRPEQTVKRHRPWDTRRQDKSFWDRF